MVVWGQFVELFRAAIIAYSQACGGNLGVGIVAVTLLVRAAMFPLGLRLARRSAAHQEAMRKLKPELEKIRKRFRTRPKRLAEETRRLLEREGVSPFPLAGCVGALAQFPVLLALFCAVRRCVAAGGRFLWIRNIARPDFLLILLVTGLTYAAVALGPNSGEHGRSLMAAIPAIVTFAVLAGMAAGVGLYWGVSNVVGLLQAAILRHERRTAPTAA